MTPFVVRMVCVEVVTRAAKAPTTVKLRPDTCPPGVAMTYGDLTFDVTDAEIAKQFGAGQFYSVTIGASK